MISSLTVKGQCNSRDMFQMEANRKFCVCKLWPKMSQSLSLRTEPRRNCTDQTNTFFPGLKRTCPSSRFGTRRSPGCLPIHCFSLPHYQLKMNSTQLSCQLQPKPFPCRAKAHIALEQYFIIYIFDENPEPVPAACTV